MKLTQLMPSLKKINFVLVLILLLAGFLRFYLLTSVPHGLYMDEASIGYNARQILHTGKDEYGQAFPLFFRSLDDYKAPGYIYLTAVSIGIFGSNDFAVRFPSALAGVIIVFVTYLLVKQLITIDKLDKDSWHFLPYVSALLVAICSSAIHFSRGGFETNLALLFYLCGLLFAIYYYKNKKLSSLIIASLFFGAATYTYQSYRILAPVTFLLTLIWFYINFKKLRQKILTAFMVFALLVFPIIFLTFSAQGSARFAGTSTFNEYKTNSLTQKIYEYPMIYLKNYISFYSYDYLFAYGDFNGRHQVPGMGMFYHWELPFLLIGVIWLFSRKKSLLKIVMLSLILLAPVVPALVAPSPHTLRGLLLVIPITILSAIGLVKSWEYLRKGRIVFIIVVICIASYESIIYIHNYYYHYPNVNALDWGGGYEETIRKTLEYKNEYKHFVVDKNIAFAKVYFNFYAPDLHPIYVDTTWKKPKDWTEGTTLYIRPFYGDTEKNHFIDVILLPGPSKTVFAQLLKI